MDAQHEMVVCIVNAGHSQDAMDAAKKAGARGGTVIRARGTANAKLEKQFGIPIQPEKEIALIIVKSEIKDDVLRALYQNCGLDSEGQGIAFSIPVLDTAGLTETAKKLPEETKEENGAS